MAAKRAASPTRVGCHSHNLRHKRNLTPIVSSAKQQRDPCSGPSTDSKELPEVRFGFPFNLIGQSNNGFFNRPIMARTQILVHSWGTEQGFRSWLADVLKQWFVVSSMAQATSVPFTERRNAYPGLHGTLITRDLKIKVFRHFPQTANAKKSGI